MRTRSAATTSGSQTPSPTASPDKAVSTRLRSRVKSKAAPAVDETPQTPTRRAQMAARKASSDLSDEAPATPTRRSTRVAAMRANDFLHETAELLNGRKRTPAAAKRAGADSSGDDAPPTPTRRPRTPRTPAARTPATRRAAAAARDSEASEDEPLAGGQSMPPRIPLDLCDLYGSESGDEPHMASLSLGSPTVATARGQTPEPEATLLRHGRQPKTAAAAAGRRRVSKGAVGSSSLPPVHPDLATAAQTLASMACATSAASASSRQSVDEDFRTAPESPEEQTPIAGRAKAEADIAAEQPADDISDLSDMEDPHYTAIMSAEAESATISAAGSIDGSVHGGSDDEDARPRGTPAKNTHVRFDSDVELASAADDDDEAPSHVPAEEQPAHGDSDSDGDDDAPEVVTSKSAGRAANEEAVVPGHKGESDSAKALKKRRARHRKRAAAAQAAEEIKDAVAEAVRRKDMSHSLPAAFPEELRPAAAEPKKESVARPVAARGDRLDASLLEAFGAEAESKRKHAGEADGADKEARKRAKKHKQRRNGLSRVVSGIRVVVSKPATSTGLLETLSQGVPDQVQRFKNRQRGGNHIARSVPLDSIARRRNQPAVSFFKL
ncbi:hypothetical protein H4R19_003976 [Coemansia spiralis]|nr:hypothetical protein H4R19_003976 [Coemansia spiralis]